MADAYNKILKLVESTNNQAGPCVGPKDWVHKWLEDQEIVIHNNERIDWDRYDRPSMRLMIESLIEDYFSQMSSFNVKKSERFGEGDLKRGVYLCLIDIQEAHRAALRDAVRYDAEADPELAELKKFCTSLTGEPLNELAFCGLQHFMWQVKRKIFGQPVTNHMMLILRGPQGCGKTQALTRLLGPLDSYVYEGPVSSVQDRNQFPNYYNNFVARCEELERVDKTDKNALKSMITAETISYRIMYSQSTDVVEQNCTFIGTSNEDITDLFKDYTGMRRLIQITTQSKEELKKHWSTINSIDYSKMWKSIPHGAKSPILKVMDNGKLTDHQKALTPKTIAQEWLSEIELGPGTFDVESSVLYNLYKAWCFGIRLNPTRPQYFSKDLATEGFIRTRKTVGGKKTTVYGCNKQLGGG